MTTPETRCAPKHPTLRSDRMPETKGGPDNARTLPGPDALGSLGRPIASTMSKDTEAPAGGVDEGDECRYCGAAPGVLCDDAPEQGHPDERQRVRLREIWTADEMVRVNSHQLTAHHLVQERREHAEAIARWARERRALIAQISQAERIGLRVMTLAAKGRKTVRLADITDRPAGDA